ncbi:MAG: hypothetical protein ACRDGM_01330 [bacterium]
MRHAPGLLREACRLGGLLVLGVVAMGAAPTEDPPGVQGSRAQTPSIISDEAIAEMNLPIPTRYAVVLHEPEKVRTMHTGTDILFDPRDPLRSFTVVQVDANRVTLRENRAGRLQSWRPGEVLAGLQGLILAGTVTLNQLRYRYKAVERVTQAEPVLLSVEGSVAILEKQVLRKVSPPALPSPSAVSTPPLQQNRGSLSPTLAVLMRAKEVGDNTHEMSGGELRPMLENLGQLMSDLNLMIAPTLFAQSGMGFLVSSSFADGLLSQSGFTVTSSKAAQIFGIDVGDTILQINNNPVTSPLSAWWAYQEAIITNPGQSEVRVDIRREGSLVTKTFRIR